MENYLQKCFKSALVSFFVMLWTQVLMAQCPVTPPTTNPDLTNFELVFEDEFNYTNINDLKEIWKTDDQLTFTSWFDDEKGMGNREAYSQENIYLSNGTVILRAEEIPPVTEVWGPYSDQRDIASGWIQYNDKEYSDCACNRKWSGDTEMRAHYGFTYGYYEAKIKIPYKHGTWPAFWLLSGMNTEIDVLEFHGEWLNPGYKDITGQGLIDWSSPTPSVDNEFVIPQIYCWHTWGLLWTEEKVTYYLDGVETYNVPSDLVQTQPCAASIIFNLAITAKGTWNQQDLEIDYIRFYKDRSRKNIITGTENYLDEVHKGDLIVKHGAKLDLEGRNALEIDYKFNIEQGGVVNLHQNASYGGMCPQKPYKWSFIPGTTVPDDQMWAPKDEVLVSGELNLLQNAKYYIPPGATHYVKSGGVINMNNYPTITVRKGSKLIVEDGGKLNLEGTDVNIVLEEGAELEIAGLLNLQGNTNLTISGKGKISVLNGGEVHSGSGFININLEESVRVENHGLFAVEDNSELTITGKGTLAFYTGGDMEFGDNTKFILEGIKPYELLEVNQGVYLHLDATSTTIRNTNIKLKSGATLVLNSFKQQNNIAGDYYIYNVDIWPNHGQKNNSIYGFGINDMTVTNSTFREMETGLQLKDHVRKLNVDNCRFDNCTYGLWMVNSTSSELDVINTTLDNNLNGATISNLHSVNFDNSNFVNCTNGIIANNVKYLYLENSTEIHHGTIGIEAAYSHIFLRGASKVHNNAVGINGIGDFNTPNTPMMIFMGDDGSCGWLTENTTGITGENIFLNIDAEDNRPAGVTTPVPNHFEDNGVIANFCFNPGFWPPNSMTIDAKGNYWGPVGQPSHTFPGGINPGALMAPFIVRPSCTNTLGGNVPVNQTKKCRELFDPTSTACDVCKDAYVHTGGGNRPNGSNGSGTGLEVLYNCGPVLGDGLGIKEKFDQGYVEFINKNYDVAIPLLEEVAGVEFRNLSNLDKLTPQCEKMIMIAEILTDKFKDKELSSTNSSPYELNATPNPAHGNLVVEYNLGDKTNGQVIIKDAITGLDMKMESINPSQSSKQININGLPNGNYIIELHGEGQFLKSDHLMVF